MRYTVVCGNDEINIEVSFHCPNAAAEYRRGFQAARSGTTPHNHTYHEMRGVALYEKMVRQTSKRMRAFIRKNLDETQNSPKRNSRPAKRAISGKTAGD